MKSETKILTAFLLNLFFSLFELVGGLLTGSVAIASDAVHDLGDAVSIGVSYALEKKSKGQPDDTYTFGYGRFSVLGGVLTSLTLLVGSLAVIGGAVLRLARPVPIHYDGMILFAIVGVCVNLGAALLTREGDSLNQRAVSLHMLEDVLGWAAVLAGAVLMRFTDLAILDPLLSMGIALFILWGALGNLKQAAGLFLEKAPHGIDPAVVREHLAELDGVREVHHIHLWSMDGQNTYATLHVVTDGEPHRIKEAIRQELLELGIGHATLELEVPGEPCHAKHCHVEHGQETGYHHHHHH